MVKKEAEEFYASLVAFQKDHVWLVLFAMLFITGIMLFFALNIKVDSSLDNQLKPEGEYLTTRGLLEGEFGSADSFFVVISIDPNEQLSESGCDIRCPETLAAISNLQRNLAEESRVVSTSSINDVFMGAFGRMPSNLEESKEFVRLLGDNGKALFNKDYSATIVAVQMEIPKTPGALSETTQRVEKIVQKTGFPKGVNATLTGQVKLLDRIIQLMINDNIATMGIALVFVFFALLYFFRKVSLAAITITPVIFSVIWLIGFMSIIGLRISTANATVAAIVVGLGVDYAIHVVNGFDTLIKKGTSKPITVTMKVIGTALFISFLTTFIGFSVNMLGSTEALRAQGITLALGVLFAFINTMILVPVLLKLKIDILREEHGDHKWR